MQLYLGDCIEIMRTLPEKCVDMVLCDLPYGTTQNKWDSIIPFDLMWGELSRVVQEGGVLVFTATQPFASALVMSNLKMFRYQWVWVKSKITGVLNAKRMPVRKHEMILVFGSTSSKSVYNPQGLLKKGTVTKQGGCSSNYGDRNTEEYVQEFTNYPRDVLEIPSEGNTVHPTQKPVTLMEYLIHTYTNEGDVVLDFTMGAGTTGVACMNTGRSFIGIERDERYFKIAQERIYAAMPIPEWLK